MDSEANDHYTELDLIRLIEDIIRGLPDSHLITQRSPTFRDPEFDIAFDQGTHTYLVDVRNVVPQTALRLKQIQRQLSAAPHLLMNNRQATMFASFSPPPV